MVGSNAWQTPGDGNAVSPDNIELWNTPYYGLVEPAQFLPKHTELYTISQWKKITGYGSVSGTVWLNGAPVPNAYVMAGGLTTTTAADGTFTLNHLATGTYGLVANALIPINSVPTEFTNGGQSGQPITLTVQNLTGVQVNLQGPPASFRRLDVAYSMSCDHGDANPSNTHGVQNAGPFYQSAELNSVVVQSSVGYNFDYNGGGYFNVNYTFSAALLADFSINVTVSGTMTDDGSHDVQAQNSLATFNVPMGESCAGSMTLEHTNGYHNGPAIFTFSVANNGQAQAAMVPLPAPPTEPDRLTAGQGLLAGQGPVSGQLIQSQDGRFIFIMQSDANLVLYGPGNKALWSSKTNGHSNPWFLQMQTDGNLVISDTSGLPFWASNTAGNPGAWLIAQSDGNVVIYTAANQSIWATNTVQH
jgi:hypothetical protein